MEKIKKYFGIKELVCPDVHKKFGEMAWVFLDPRMLAVMLYIREGIGRPMWVNNWAVGGKLTQRGLRCNLCQLVKEKAKAGQLYMSAHQEGMGWDFNIEGMTPAQVRRWIVEHQAGLPYPIRMEEGTPTWVHVDVRHDGEGGKIKFFRG